MSRPRLALSLGMILAVGLRTMAFAATALHAPPLTADLTRHIVEITSGFNGSEIILFGAITEPGELVATIRGPDQHVVVREKERHFGVWFNRRHQNFAAVPAFFAVAASRPLDEIAPPALRAALTLDVDAFDFAPDVIGGQRDAERFRAALIAARRKLGLYAESATPLTRLSPNLFRASIQLPAQVPTGSYTVSVYLIRDGRLIATEASPLIVTESGIGAMILDASRQNPLLFGLTAVALAALAGYGATYLMRSR